MNTRKSHRQAILAGDVLPSMSFVEKVWAMTSRIPRGKVTTYARLAKALDSRAYRAVGMAMNRNPYAPAVPCHRVVGADGRLTGYGGGLERKRALLDLELRNAGADVLLRAWSTTA